jgi:hypothetical protein
LDTCGRRNVGANKDSEKRRRAAIEAYAKANGYKIAADDWFYDAAVKGIDAITEREGFSRMLAHRRQWRAGDHL